MRVYGLNRIVPAAAVAAIVAMCASDAFAWRGSSSSSSGSYGSSSSSSGSYGSYGSSSSSSGSYGSSSSGSSGSHGGLFARWHARKAARASSSSGSYGSSSSSSGSYGSYGSSSSGSSSSSSGSYGSYGGGYYESAPMEMEAQPMMEGAPAAAPAAAPAEPPAPPQASINVTVPADAVVYVNDRPTTSTGATRHYISRGLMMGRTYAYQIRVEFQKDGEKVVENKLVRLQAGQSEELTFGNGEQMAKEAEPAKTQVTVHVPAGAKVTLAGAETHQTGELRTFVTGTLASGERWDGYKVIVTLEQDGKTLTEEKSLSIEGGQKYELSFDFADNTAQVASVN